MDRIYGSKIKYKNNVCENISTEGVITGAVADLRKTVKKLST